MSAGSVGRRWTDVTVNELKIFIAIIIYMGIIRITDTRRYWSVSDVLPHHSITSLMSLTRFEQLKRFFKVSSRAAEESTDPAMQVWYRKVNPMFDNFILRSRKLRDPGTLHSLDEAMIRFAGRSSSTYQMRSKPIT